MVDNSTQRVYNPLVLWHDDIGLHYVFTVAIVVVTIMIIGTNILNISVITKTASLCNPSGYFIIQLSAVDLMTGIFMGLFAIPSAVLNRWPFGETVCSLVGYCGTLTITLSVNSLAIVSIDRYLYIVWPFKYTGLLTSKRAYTIIAVVWALNISFYVIPFMVEEWNVDMQFHYWDGAFICSFGFENNYPFFMASLGLMFIPSMLIIIFCHVSMYVTARKHLKALESARGRIEPPSAEATTALQASNAFKTVSTILLAFTIAYLPKVCYTLSLTVITRYRLNIKAPTYMSGVVWWMAISNSFMNFFIYSFRNKDFRYTAKKILLAAIQSLSKPFWCSNRVADENTVGGFSLQLQNSGC